VALNVDADVVHADWLRVVARMRVIAAAYPNLTETEVRAEAEKSISAS